MVVKKPEIPKTPFGVFRVLRVIRDSDKNGDNYFTHPDGLNMKTLDIHNEFC